MVAVTRASRVTQAVIVRRAVAGGDYDAETGTTLARSLEALARATDPLDDQVDQEFCGFLGTVMARRGPDVHDFLSGLTSYGPQRRVELEHGCGRRLFRLTTTVDALRGGHRHLYVCERCGVSANVPATGELPEALLPSATTMTVHTGQRWRHGWYVACRQPVGLHRDPPAEVRAVDGDISLTLPTRPTAGIRRWAVAVVSGADYAVVQLPVPSGHAHGEGQS